MATTDQTLKRDPKLGEFFGFNSNTRVFGFTKKLEIVERNLAFYEDAAEPEGRTFTSPEFVLPLLGGFTLPPGLTVISGSTAVGKSRFIRALREVMPISRYCVVEPPDGEEDLLNTPVFGNVDAALVAAIRSHQLALASKQAPRLVALDSLRAPLFETSGAAGEKGVIMPFFTKITRVSNTLMKHGISVIATVNPMNDDDKFEAAFLQKLSASTSCYIELTKAAKGFSGSISIRPERVPRAFSTDLTSAKAAPVEMATFTLPEMEGPLGEALRLNRIIRSINEQTNS